MKILSVTLIPPENDAQWTRIDNIAYFLKKNNRDVELAHYLRKNCENHEDNLIINTHPTKMGYKHLKLLRQGQYDLVYGNTFGGAFFCLGGKLLKKPLILDMHGIAEEYSFLNQPKSTQIQMKLMEKLSLLFADMILCVSHEMIKYLHGEKKVPLEKLFFVPNGVDLDFFQPVLGEETLELRRKYGLEDKMVFGYIGGMQAYQGVDNFVAAAQALDDEKFAAVVVGCDIPESLKEGNVTYIPRISREEITKYYSLCDVLVIPRPHDIVTQVADPTKFGEYSAMGKPILLTEVGDAAALVKKYNNGLLVPDNQIENLKKGMMEFMGLDKEKIKQMGVNSRILAETEFDWEKIVASLVNFLDSQFGREEIKDAETLKKSSA